MDPTLDKAAQSTPAEYGLEVLCASWNPLAATMTEPAAARRELAAEPAALDAESFLSIFYRTQQG
ncbi:MAG TPA: hypothetical protein VIA19_12565 [Burkholderiales bacterium]|jgi:hypothetical protein